MKFDVFNVLGLNNGNKVAVSAKFDADSLTIDDILAKCEQLNTKFIDLEFLPGPAALMPPSPDTKAKLVHWRRAPDFLGPDVAMFRDGISPNDIQQGELGDCWFVNSTY